MKTVLVDPTASLRFAPPVYPLLNNVLRNNVYNTQQMWERVGEKNLNLFNQNILVGILQTLAIDPEWTLDYVIAFTQMRSRSICSAFEILSMSNSKGVHKDTLIYGGCTECYALLENTRDLTSANYSDLVPLVPVYSTITDWSYNPPAERERKCEMDYRNDFAFIGINFVELAVGWWLYMKDEQFAGHGIHHFLSNVVGPQFQLLHNQLAYYNAVSAVVTDDLSPSTLLHTEKLDFNTVAIRKELIDVLNFQTTRMQGVSWKSHELLMDFLRSSLIPSIRFLFNADQYDLNYTENVVWGFELNAIKYYTMYLRLCESTGMIPDGKKAELQRYVPWLKARWKRISDSDFRNHALGQLDKINLLLA